MQRSRLKNIISKSKQQSKPIVGEFEQFRNSLPKELEIGDNYRLEAAWKAYGKPKNYQEALWEGLVQPIDDKTFKMPSIGYNEETEEYEYLNMGEDNDTVNKDIRVWDNDVIPFVKELKHGGYIRVYNDEKDCWTYSKNPNTIEIQQIIETFGKGKKIKKVKSDKSYYDSETNTIYYTDDEALKYELFNINPDNKLLKYLKPYYEDLTDDKIQSLGGDLEFVKRLDNDLYNPIKLGAKVSAAHSKIKNNKYTPDFFKKMRENENQFGDNMRDLLHMYNDENLSKIFNYYSNKGITAGGSYTFQDPNGEIGDGMPLKPTGTYAEDGQEYYVSPTGDLYTLNPQSFKQGGQMNVIPEGALHARKNNMEGAGEDFTHKGIPVVDNDGEQQAEIERNEVIFNKDLTDFIESNYKKFKSEETSNSEKDEIAIKVGKRLVKELLTNTDDRTGLISEVEQKM